MTIYPRNLCYPQNVTECEVVKMRYILTNCFCTMITFGDFFLWLFFKYRTGFRPACGALHLTLPCFRYVNAGDERSRR